MASAESATKKYEEERKVQKKSNGMEVPNPPKCRGVPEEYEERVMEWKFQNPNAAKCRGVLVGELCF